MDKADPLEKESSRNSKRTLKSSERNRSKDTISKDSTVHASELFSDSDSSGDSGMELAPIKVWNPSDQNNLKHLTQPPKRVDPLTILGRTPVLNKRKLPTEYPSAKFMTIQIGNEAEKSTTQKKSKQDSSDTNNPFTSIISGFSNQKNELDKSEALNEVSKRFDFISGLNKQSMKSFGKMVAAESLNYKQAKDYLTKYFFIKGKYPVVLILILFLMSSLFTVSYDVWIGFWSQDTFKQSAVFYFWFYLVLSMVGTIYMVLRDIVYDHIMYNSSNLINKIVMGIVLRLRMKWFDHQPVDRVMYRLTKDQSQLDILIPKLILKTIESCMMVIVGFIILNYVYFGLIILVSLFYVCIITSLFKKFLRVTLKITHFVSIKKSEVVSIMSQNLNVCMLLRSTGNLDYLKKKFQRQNDSFQQCTTHVGNFLQRWIGMRLTYIGASLVFGGFLYPILASFARNFFFQQVWKIAFSMTWSFKTVKYLKRFIRSVSLVFSNMISISRLYEYVETVDDLEISFEEALQKKQKVKLKGEKKLQSKFTQISNKVAPALNSRRTISTNDTESRNSIFSNGSSSSKNPIVLLQKYKFNSISLKNVSLSLSGQDQVLKNISMSIKSSETVGLYGRTMSGIPHLLPLICGLYDRERELNTSQLQGSNLAFSYGNVSKISTKIDSEIKISNISIDKINPKNWRKSFMYLAEEPLIFAGSVRDNIDPYKLFDDDIIIKTLEYLKFNELVNLVNKVESEFTVNNVKNNQAKKNRFGLSAIREEDELDINQLTPSSSSNSSSYYDREDVRKPQQASKLPLSFTNKWEIPITKKKLDNSNFWDLGNPAEEEKEIESAINIGSETNQTDTRPNTKIGDTTTKASKSKTNPFIQTLETFALKNGQKAKDLNNQSNGSWAELLRENEKEVEKEMARKSNRKFTQDKIMSAIDITENKQNTEINNFKKGGFQEPALNLDRRESNSEKNINTGQDPIPELHPDLLLNQVPKSNLKKSSGTLQGSRFSLVIPGIRRRFDSQNADSIIREKNTQDKLMKTNGFKEEELSSQFSKMPNGFRGILRNDDEANKEDEYLEGMRVDSPPVKPRNIGAFQDSEDLESSNSSTLGDDHFLREKRDSSTSKTRKSWVNQISKYVTSREPFIKKVEKINAGDPNFKFTHPQNMYEFEDFDTIDRCNIEKFKVSPSHRENIEDFLEYKVAAKAGNLTIGLKKIIMIARVFLEEPPIIILDENSIDFDELDNSFFFKVFKVSPPNLLTFINLSIVNEKHSHPQNDHDGFPLGPGQSNHHGKWTHQGARTSTKIAHAEKFRVVKGGERSG